MKPTIKDVARLAGTSTGTVSRVLNNRPTVAVKTRLKVEAAIEQLGFQADVSARTLAKARRTVALVQPFDADYHPFYAQLTRAFLRDTEARGWRGTQVFPDEVLGSRADAVIFLRDDVPEQALERLLTRSLPVAVIGDSDFAPYICTQNEEGVASATRLLRKTGHRRIAYLGWVTYPDGSYSPRGMGYERALAETPALHEPFFLGGDHTSLDAYRAITKAWFRKDRFDGLVCSSDAAALGALAAFEDLKVRVPEGCVYYRVRRFARTAPCCEHSSARLCCPSGGSARVCRRRGEYQQLQSVLGGDANRSSQSDCVTTKLVIFWLRGREANLLHSY